MKLPVLKKDTRRREYDLYAEEQRCKVLYYWLFEGKSTRKLDTEVLGLDGDKSRGWQSKGIIHFLGLNEEFKGIFKGKSIREVIDRLYTEKEEYVTIAKRIKF